MSNIDLERARQVFLEARELDAARRGEYLDRTCLNDPAFRSEVEKLLAADQERTLAAPQFQVASEARLAHVGPYRIVEKLGEGGMGTVYKAEQRTPVRRTVAIKLVKQGMATAEVLARFESERQALARMNHPHVAKVLDAGADDLDRPYFVMEYVPGEVITRFADKNKLTISQRLELFIQVCQAISHAHTKQILHRDIKASNVLAYMDEGKPTAKVIDFGIAKALTGDKLTDRTFNTDRGQVVGTYDSMSPEQADGSADIDTRTDVYSLGVLLYELLSGARPFDSKTLQKAGDQEIRRIIREVDPPKPSTRLSGLTAAEGSTIAAARRERIEVLAKELRSELEWIPLMAMRKERDRRYSSPAALAGDIKDYLEGKPLLAAPDSAAYRASKFLRRNRGPIIAAASMLAVLLLGIAGTTVGLVAARRATARALAEQKRTEAALVEAGRQRDEAQRQEQEAKNQRDIADVVCAFQTDMLETADPDKIAGDKVTIVQAMDAAVKRLDARELELRPLSEAKIRETIGNTFYTLGRYPKAEPNFRIALHLRRQVLSPGDPAIVENLSDLGATLASENKLPEAEDFCREALDICRTVSPAAAPEIASSLIRLAGVLGQEGKLAEAELLYREALSIDRNAVPARNPEELRRSIDCLARVLKMEKKLAEAAIVLGEEHSMEREMQESDLKAVLGAPTRPPPLNPVANEERRKHFVNSIGIGLVEIKPGSFLMGSPVNEPLRKSDETQHEVTITKGFFIGRTAITQKQYGAVTGQFPSRFAGDDLPVESVTRAQAVVFCKLLSDKEGRHYRLPTEAEWEYTCRAGTKSVYYTGDDERSLARAAWYGGRRSTGNSSFTTHPVGELQPNGWGLFDQLGNVHEFCSDWYGEYAEGKQTDPSGPATGSRAVARGGSWVDDLHDTFWNHRSANRISVGLEERWSTLGFRVVLETDGGVCDTSFALPASSQPADRNAAAKPRSAAEPPYQK